MKRYYTHLQFGLFLYFILASFSLQAQLNHYTLRLNECLKDIHKGDVFENLEASQRCMLGSPLPYFESELYSGGRFNSHNSDKKLTIINFWHAHCPPCIAEIPGLNKLAEQYGKDIRFIGITTDKKTKLKRKKFFDKHPFIFEHITDADALIFETFQLAWGFPTTLIVNNKGEIIEIINGSMESEEAEEEIQRILLPFIQEALKS